jgi:hypothetical protein
VAGLSGALQAAMGRIFWAVAAIAAAAFLVSLRFPRVAIGGAREPAGTVPVDRASLAEVPPERAQ